MNFLNEGKIGLQNELSISFKICQICGDENCYLKRVCKAYLDEKYFPEFFFYLAKQINEIIFGVFHQPHVILFKENLIWIDSREHFKQYFSKLQSLKFLCELQNETGKNEKANEKGFSLKSTFYSGNSKTLLSLSRKCSKNDEKLFPKFYQRKISEIMLKREKKYHKLTIKDQLKGKSANTDFKPILEEIHVYEPNSKKKSFESRNDSDFHDIYNPKLSKTIEVSIEEDFPDFFFEPDLASPFNLEKSSKSFRSPKKKIKVTKKPKNSAPKKILPKDFLSESNWKAKHETCLARITNIVGKYAVNSSFKALNNSASYNSILQNLTERLKSKKERSGFFTFRLK